MDDVRYKNKFVWNNKTYSYYDITKDEDSKDKELKNRKLPFIIRILFESYLRGEEAGRVTKEQISLIKNWKPKEKSTELPFYPERIVLQDFTGVPVILDLVALREYIDIYARNKGLSDEEKKELKSFINPEIPVDLVIDHSIQVDYYKGKESFFKNQSIEMERNKERYQFLTWAKEQFHRLRVIPPATGIIHQVNMEYLASIVQEKEENGETLLYPETLVGTDSHTTMINGLGILGWGVGGIEAEAGMLGLPSYIPFPRVIGVRLFGKRQSTVTATDIALFITKTLRKIGVVDCFVEFFGEGAKDLSVEDRTTIANMAPEYGATTGFFPVDEKVITYLKMTGRDKDSCDLYQYYLKQNQMFQTYEEEMEYSKRIEIDLSQIYPAIAGPKRPQDFLNLAEVKENLIQSISRPIKESGFGLLQNELEKKIEFDLEEEKRSLKTGDILIAAITSCTNTSNPSVMIAAGLLAKKAVEKGLVVSPTIKTSLSPGSRVVTAYLKKSGLLTYLEQLGFFVTGYGCTTCIGNSGPLLPEIEQVVKENGLLCSSVLSGNRNFEGRIHPLVKANYLASPPLVIAYALKGTMLCDLTKESIGVDKENNPVYLNDIWPKKEEIDEILKEVLSPDLYQEQYKDIYRKNELWNQLQEELDTYTLPKDSLYIKVPPFLESNDDSKKLESQYKNMYVLAKLGDSITTDHISPAGAIAKDSPAGKYLMEHGTSFSDFNTYGSRRGNDEVMVRGTFANIRIQNELANGKEGGYTRFLPTNEIMSIYDASKAYQKHGNSLLILAGKDYGMGSSRDWAAKGTSLLGVKAVLAESYERIHRSNLTMMGILPLEYRIGECAESLGLTGEETYTFDWQGRNQEIGEMKAKAIKTDGTTIEFVVKIRLDAKVEKEYLQIGGILPYVSKKKSLDMRSLI